MSATGRLATKGGLATKVGVESIASGNFLFRCRLWVLFNILMIAPHACSGFGAFVLKGSDARSLTASRK